MRYEVEYKCPQGAKGVAEYSDCKDAGMAFAKCHKEHPDCEVVRATAISGVGSYTGKMEHEYPSVHQLHPVKEPRPARALKPDEHLEATMPFYDTVRRQIS